MVLQFNSFSCFLKNSLLTLIRCTSAALPPNRKASQPYSQSPRAGWPILVSFHKMRGLQWQYSCARSPHGEVKRLRKAIMGSVTNFPYTGSVIKHNNKMTEEYHKGLGRKIKFIIPIKVLMTSKLIKKLIRNYS